MSQIITLGMYKVVVPIGAKKSIEGEKPTKEDITSAKAELAEYELYERLVVKHYALADRIKSSLEKVKQAPEDEAAKSELASLKAELGSLDPFATLKRMLSIQDNLAGMGLEDPEKIRKAFGLLITQAIADLGLKTLKVEICDFS